jgi:hypothetical protein
MPSPIPFPDPVPRLPSWAPPLPPQPSRPNPPPWPPLTLLTTIFDWAYLTLPATVHGLPPRLQSDALLRRVAIGCRSLLLSARSFDHDHMVRDPDRFLGEYLTLMALADVDIDDLISDWHRCDPDDPFPARCLDPRERTGWPAGQA